MTRHSTRTAVERSIGVLTALVVLIGGIACHAVPPATRVPNPAGGPAAQYDPARDLGPLFHDVQMARVFDDSKTFVDATPRAAPADIAARYVASRSAEGFDLRAFVARNFTPPRSPRPTVAAAPSRFDGITYRRPVADAHPAPGPPRRVVLADSSAVPIRGARRTLP